MNLVQCLYMEIYVSPEGASETRSVEVAIEFFKDYKANSSFEEYLSTKYSKTFRYLILYFKHSSNTECFSSECEIDISLKSNSIFNYLNIL